MKSITTGTNRNFANLSYNSTPVNRKASKLLRLFLLGVAVCAIASIGGTFAWFTLSSDTQLPTIQAARYDITATEHDDVVTFEKVGNSYTALFEPRELPYDILLEEAAGSTATTGYCKIECNGEVLYTEQFPSESNTDGTFGFYIAILGSPAEVKITPHWGTHNPSSDDEQLITDGKAIFISESSVKVEELHDSSLEEGESNSESLEPPSDEEVPEQDIPSEPEALTAPKDATETTTAPKDAMEALTAPKDTTEATTTPKDATEATTTPEDATEATTTPKAVTEATTTPKAVTEATTTPEDATEATTTSGAVTEATTTPKAVTEATTTPKDATEATTTPEAATEATTTSEAATEATTTSGKESETPQEPEST